MSVDREKVWSELREIAGRFYPDWDEDALNGLADELIDCIDAAGEDTDPRSMGWVDDRGLP